MHLSYCLLHSLRKCDWLLNFRRTWPARCTDILHQTKRGYHIDFYSRFSSLAERCSRMSDGNISIPRGISPTSHITYLTVPHRTPLSLSQPSGGRLPSLGSPCCLSCPKLKCLTPNLAICNSRVSLSIWATSRLSGIHDRHAHIAATSR